LLSQGIEQKGWNTTSRGESELRSGIPLNRSREMPPISAETLRNVIQYTFAYSRLVKTPIGSRWNGVLRKKCSRKPMVHEAA